MENDPWSGRQQHWQVNAAENWSDLTSDRHSASGSDYGSSWSWSSSRWSAREWEQWQNWDTLVFNASQDDQSEEGKYSNWTWRSSSWLRRSMEEVVEFRVNYLMAELYLEMTMDKNIVWKNVNDPDQRPQGDEGTGATPLSPTSPQAQRLKDKDNRPMGEIPSGVPSVAGNNSQQQAPGAVRQDQLILSADLQRSSRRELGAVLEERDLLGGLRREVTTCGNAGSEADATAERASSQDSPALDGVGRLWQRWDPEDQGGDGAQSHHQAVGSEEDRPEEAEVHETGKAER